MEIHLCSLIGIFNIVNMSVLPSAIYRYSVIPIKFSQSLLEKPRLKFIWNCKGSQIAKRILKKNKLTGLTSWFQNLLQGYSNQNCGTLIRIDILTDGIKLRVQ
jgi:hypothetical protein